jgi:hypothetical protein
MLRLRHRSWPQPVGWASRLTLSPMGRTAVSAINAWDRLQLTGYIVRNLRDIGHTEAGGAGVSPAID